MSRRGHWCGRAGRRWRHRDGAFTVGKLGRMLLALTLALALVFLVELLTPMLYQVAHEPLELRAGDDMWSKQAGVGSSQRLCNLDGVGIGVQLAHGHCALAELSVNRIHERERGWLEHHAKRASHDLLAIPVLHGGS